jgi:hypothetical protein
MRVQGLAALSQATGAAQLGALLLAVGPTRGSDAYFTLFTASQLPVSILVLGTLQPAILSRPGYAGWARWTLVAVIVNAPWLWLTAGFLLANGYASHDVLWVAGLLTASASVAIACSVHAVHAAARGRPELLAGSTVIPNTCASILVLAPTPYRIQLMCTGLLVGNIATYLLARAIVRSAVGAWQRDPLKSQVSSHQSLAGTRGLLVASTVGATGPFALQAVTATYTAGQATLLGFMSKLGNGVVGIGVTTFTNVATDWHRRSVRPLRVAAGYFTVALTLVLVGLAVAGLVGSVEAVKTALAATAWVLAAASQSCSGRALGMLGQLQVFQRAAAAGVLLYGGATLALIQGPHTALTYFVILTTVATVTNLIFLTGLGWRRETATCLAGLLLLALPLAGVASAPGL